MKQTKNFNINVPELGDKPDITQVSDAIQALEDALAGTLEIMNAEIQGTKLTLTSGARTTKRTKYYEGMAIKFVAPIQINPNTVTTVSVDGLSDQTLQIPYLVNAGDSADIIYKEDKFVGAITAIQRSNAIDSTSDTTVATSLAVKTINDKKAEKTVQIIAGNGLTGGGDLTTNRTINIVSADDSIIVSADNIRVNTTNDVDSTSTTRPASARAVKGAYDKAVEGVNKANAAQSTADSKVSKSGDTMTGTLRIEQSDATGLILSRSNVKTSNNNIEFRYTDGSYYFGLVNGMLKIGSVVDLTSGNSIYHTGFKPTPDEIKAPALRPTISSQDWNSIKSPGYYKVQNATGANKAPGYQFGVLEVVRGEDASEDRSLQIYYPHRTDEGPKIRMHNGSSWNSWVEIYTSGRKPTASDIGLGDAWRNSNVQFSKSGNGYMRLPNGMLIQWGHRSGMGNNTTNYTSFPVAFSTTEYRVVYQKVSADHSNNTPMRTTAREGGRFGVYTYGVYSIDWIAVGW